MKNKEQFDKSVDILVKAYFAGTLNADKCSACAVGNILGHRNWVGGNRMYYPTCVTTVKEIRLLVDYNTSGYDERELASIESAFLKGVDYPELCPTDSGNFKGLMAVLDVLQQIHECTDEETKEAKMKFERV